ncbi:MAG TPA: ribonuclease HI [Candidatus Enterousia avicola]|uniref:Ribonuclease H n=1 Tax=Candidatus Enterousia avicola TaxID=2840787 RepID=A0A9D1MTF3_9PROT|nr:ribonuclease HI [Candidatus Enterousia avicola]
MLKIWTDGSCLGNPGPGGWAFIATNGKDVAERNGGEANTTNNRMELTAVIKALSAAKKHDEIEIHTDSQYVKNGMEKWVRQWKNNNWKNAEKKPVKNKELWQQLDELAQQKSIKWVWVKGHAGQEMNERCDELARNAAEKYK